jgi:sugar phosphate isomerase/epimerase
MNKSSGMGGCVHDDRRRFLAMGLAAGATLLLPRIAYSAEEDGIVQAAKAQIAWGFCGSISNAKMLKSAGCDYVEEKVGDVLMPDEGDDQFAKRLPEISASLLPVTCCNNFLPGNLKSVGPEAKHAKILAYADIAFHRARMCGVKTITFGSGASRKIPGGFSKEEATKQFVDLLHRMGQIAAAQEITVAVEPLNAGECNFLNNIREVAAVVAAADHAAIGITADLYHMALGGDVPEDLDRAVKFLRHFHLAEKEKRALPGVAGDDFRGWFKVLAKHGWKGRISIEAGGGDQAAYTKAFAYLRKQAGEAGI